VEIRCGLNWTFHWSVFKKFSLHLIFSGNAVVTDGIIHSSWSCSPACWLTFSRVPKRCFWAYWGSAILTYLHISRSFSPVLGYVLLTWRVNNTMGICISPNICWFTSSCAVSSTWLEIDNILSTQSDRSETSGLTKKNVKSISKRRSWSLSPAWSTVLWNMLILVPRSKIVSVNISPV
jgi:hypothetical protein